LIARAGVAVDKALGRIEGCAAAGVLGGEIHIVQTRPQV
jgi:hypothetical protein